MEMRTVLLIVMFTHLITDKVSKGEKLWLVVMTQQLRTIVTFHGF